MSSFTLNNDYHFLRFFDTHDLNNPFGVAVREMSQKPDGNIHEGKSIIARLHPGITTFSNKLEIYGFVIDGFKLQQLIEEIHDGDLVVNRQGLCLSYVHTSSIEYKAFYPLHDLFNWRKYGVNAPYPPRELWSGIGTFPQVPMFNFPDKDPNWNVGQSKEIRLNASDLFISCKDGESEGPLILWKVDSPSGHVREVRFMGIIDCQKDMSRLEVNGVTLQGGNKLRPLCKELMGRQVMVNADGWCLFYTGDPIYSTNRFGQGGNYYKILFLFDWKRYKVPTSTNNSSQLWGQKYYLDEVQTITQMVFSPKQHACRVKADEKTKSAGSDSEKTKGVIYQKEKLKKLESQLQVKKEDLRHREEEYEKLKKEVKTLRATQNKGIMGSVYREYCRDKSFEKRLQQLFAVSGEMHVVLAFARDYDESDIHTDGDFRVSFDQVNVTPQFIANFKKNLPSNSIVKFFLCIGNRNEKYPFRIVHKDKWIAKATSSLQGIIKRYGFDGIDVYYTRIHTQFKDFVDAIGTVINNLMINGTITTASLAPCHFMNAMSYEFYDELYNRNHHIFDYVVYQTHDDAHSNPLNNPQALITDFNDLVSNHNYPKHKLLVGHSILLKDWDAVPYPVILSALPQLFRDDTVKGTSVWTLTENLE